MSRVRCDDCGKRFNSQYNLELHQKHRCEGSAAGDGETADDEVTFALDGTERVRDAEGTVSHYDEDGGYGFVMTADLAGRVVPDVSGTIEVFFHVSAADTGWLEAGDRLRFDVVEGDRGLECEAVSVVARARDRAEYDDPDGFDRAHGFGHGKDDTQRGPGKAGPTEQEIEDFGDERKFR